MTTYRYLTVELDGDEITVRAVYVPGLPATHIDPPEPPRAENIQTPQTGGAWADAEDHFTDMQCEQIEDAIVEGETHIEIEPQPIEDLYL